MSAAGAGAEGWPADRLFAACGPCGLNEICILPGISPTRPAGVETTTKLTRNIDLRAPLLAGPCWDVVSSDMARALALAGSIGFIHREQSIASQADMVKAVKDTQHGFILEPATLGPYDMVADVDHLRATRGLAAIPITDNRRTGGKLMGLVTSRDIEGIQDRKSTRLGTIMIPVKDLVVAQEPITLKEAQATLLREKVGKLPIVNKDRELVAMICRGDIRRQRDEPQAARDANRQLIVGASVSASGSDWQRAEALITAGADVLNVEIDDGVSDATIDFIKQLKSSFQGVDVIIGKVTSCAQAKSVLDAGADALRIGAPMAGLSEASMIYEIANFARSQYGIPVIADVDMSSSSHMLKALCLGASAVVVDNMLRGSDAIPGNVVYGGESIRYKVNKSAPDSSKRPQEEQCQILSKGSSKLLVQSLVAGIRQDVADLGLTGIPQLHQALAGGSLRMERCIA
mmetsp:Transcript_54196/g.129108  ORF Transcript_54196/g.129108 Transcript_54196/m.129108 type:complete len:460 (+) Transcript_54196:81-1460(+)